MDAIERAIRNALQKGAWEDRAFREKVYRQAFAALERALQANPTVTVETAIRRRKGLQAKVSEIESEYLPPLPETPVAAPPPVAEPTTDGPASPDTAEVAPNVTIDVGSPGETSPADVEVHAPDHSEPELTENASGPGTTQEIPVAPDIKVETGGPTPVVPDIMLETAAESPPIDPAALPGAAAVQPDRDLARAEKRRPFAAIFFGVTLLCAAAIGIWWAVQTGLINPPQDDLTGIEEPPAETEDFEPGAEGEPLKPGEVDAERPWIAIFAPAEPATVSTPGDAKAEVLEESSGQFMRIRSGTSGSAIIFDVGQGVLEQIAGKKATFDIVARAEEGKDTQMSVDCNFGELGDCGRKRYAVSGPRADYLFEMDMPAGTPGAGGTIAINSDFSNSGKAVDIFEIRVSVAP